MISALLATTIAFARTLDDPRQVVRSLTGHSCGVLDKTMIVVGGDWGNDHTSLTVPFCLRLPDDWSTGPSVGRRCGFAGAAVVAGRIYVIGGIPEQEKCSAGVISWDGQANSWHSHAAMPTPRNRLACADVGDFIYAIGGMDVRGNSCACERYDTKNDSWVKLAPMPTPRHGHALVAIGERIFALGGEAGRSVGPVEVFDTKSGGWETWPSMPSDRLFFGAIAAEDAIYAFGGRTVGATPSWKLDLKTRKWSESEWPPPMERDRFACGVVACADGSRDLVIVGGEDAHGQAVKDGVLRFRLPSN